MKSHELAKLLLSKPDREVLIETGHGRKECKLYTTEWYSYSPPEHDCLVVVQDRTDNHD